MSLQGSLCTGKHGEQVQLTCSKPLRRLLVSHRQHGAISQAITCTGSMVQEGAGSRVQRCHSESALCRCLVAVLHVEWCCRSSDQVPSCKLLAGHLAFMQVPGLHQAPVFMQLIKLEATHQGAACASCDGCKVVDQLPFLVHMRSML